MMRFEAEILTVDYPLAFSRLLPPLSPVAGDSAAARLFARAGEDRAALDSLPEPLSEELLVCAVGASRTRIHSALAQAFSKDELGQYITVGGVQVERAQGKGLLLRLQNVDIQYRALINGPSAAALFGRDLWKVKSAALLPPAALEKLMEKALADNQLQESVLSRMAEMLCATGFRLTLKHMRLESLSVPDMLEPDAPLLFSSELARALNEAAGFEHRE